MLLSILCNVFVEINLQNEVLRPLKQFEVIVRHGHLYGGTKCASMVRIDIIQRGYYGASYWLPFIKNMLEIITRYLVSVDRKGLSNIRTN
jgi:hypothetical protein